jgi:peptidoglycan/xylan/chitin deacetylase (PgdA/CDA1 family)
MFLLSNADGGRFEVGDGHVRERVKHVKQDIGNQKLRVAFLVSSDVASTRRSIEAVCAVPGIEPVAILRETAAVPLFRRLKNLARHIRANGWLAYRLMAAVGSATEVALERAAVSPADVLEVLRKAFPERCFSLTELGTKYGMAVHAVGNLNSAQAADVLRKCGATLGIVLGTRILKPGTFSVPAMGCINLHKGKVPEYRGMPPGFWELYDGVRSAGVTVHFVDEGLDTGDIVASSTVPIAKYETPDSLLEKLHQEGARLLAEAVTALRDGTATRQPQERGSHKPRRRPTRTEVALLQRRLPHWNPKGGAGRTARNLYHLLVYYSGIYALVRWWHSLRGPSRGAIFLYHRVNDYANDVLTVDTKTFATQLLAISRHYPVSSTDRLVDCVRNRKRIPPTTVAIHFDDCYRDVLTEGAPVLNALGIPACIFVSSGFVDTDRMFPHDAAKYPFAFENFHSEDLRTWIGQGFEIGAHTVNHVDLGSCTPEEADTEVVTCGQALAETVGQPVTLFSFPFGRAYNICSSARNAISTAGYTALFSTYGNFVGSHTDPYDIPRIGAATAPALYCLLQVEGLALSQVVGALRQMVGYLRRWCRRPMSGRNRVDGFNLAKPGI